MLTSTLVCAACEKPFQHWEGRFLQPAGRAKWCDDCNRAAMVKALTLDKEEAGTELPLTGDAIADGWRRKRAAQFGIRAVIMADTHIG